NDASHTENNQITSVFRIPTLLFTAYHTSYLLTGCNNFSTPHRRFTFVHPHYPFLILFMVKPFLRRSAPLSGLKPSSVRRLLWSIARLQLPPSQIQHAANIFTVYYFSAHYDVFVVLSSPADLILIIGLFLFDN